MARTALTVQEGTRLTVLTNPTQNTPDVANGNSFINDGKTILYVTNGSGGNVVITVDYPTLVDTDLVVADRSYTVATGTRTVIGPFPTTYNQTDNSIANQVLINFDVSTSTTVEVIRVTGA